MHILHNILYLKVSYTGRNVIPNIYSILVKASYYPLALFFCSILQLDLCGAARMSKQIQLGQCFSSCLESGAKLFFSTLYSNLVSQKHQSNRTFALSPLRVLNAFASSIGSEEQFLEGKISSVSNSSELKLHSYCTMPSIGWHLLVPTVHTWLLTPLMLYS